MSGARFFSGLSLGVWLGAYALGSVLLWIVYALLPVVLAVSAIGLVLALRRRPVDRAALAMLGLGPLLVVVPPALVAVLDESGLVTHEALSSPLHGPWEITRVTAPFWLPLLAFAGFVCALRLRNAGTGSFRLAAVLFALSLPGVLLLPSALLLLRDGFGYPSPGLLVMAPVEAIAWRGFGLGLETCTGPAARQAVARFATHLAVIASTTLVISAIASIVAVISGAPGSHPLYAPLAPLPLGAPLIGLSLVWLFTARWLRAVTR